MHPMVTRAKADIFKPLKRMNCHVTTTSPLPLSHVHALRDSNWKEAMLDEYNALITNGTWVLVPRPANVNVVRSMWLFKHKFRADGSLSRYKAHLVANGRSQQQGIDCDETFSPVVKPATIRTILSLVAPRAWFQRFASFATQIGFQHSKIDASLFIYHYGSDIAYLLLSVDDIILTASSITLLQHIIGSLHGEFEMTDLEILERAHMQHFNPCKTPVDTESKIGPEGNPISDPTLYRSLAGALQYFTFKRPDLSYVVQHVCLYMHDPREPHLFSLKRILRYVCGTLDHGLQLHVSSMTQLVAYTDADWAGCPVTRHVEAEYRGVANVVTETAWIRNLLRELLTPLFTTTLVYCDNVSAVYLSTNPVQHQRTKHIEIDIHFVRDYVASGQVSVLHVPSRFHYADIFKKGMPTALFLEFCSSLNV
ncbi:ribonuclease H-like domain-containing protein [Tanacetum coccineum]